MANQRRKFSAEFKAEAVQLVVQSDRPVARVARELDVNESTLGYWVKAYRAQHGLVPGEPAGEDTPTPVTTARIAALEVENQERADPAFEIVDSDVDARSDVSHVMGGCPKQLEGSDAVGQLARVAGR